MRKSMLATAVLLSSAIAVTGCGSINKIGDLGNKNIRPNTVNNNPRFANDQENSRNRMYGRRLSNNNVIGTHGNSHLEWADAVAKQIVTMPGIKSAYVIKTNHSAYVAVVTKHPNNQPISVDITNEMKNKIADHVKAMAPDIHDVYVSANPDFTGRMESYAKSVRSGHPIQGFLSEFNALVERIFPASAGNR
jgi:YhcN/YlaJ family sporulation lipoprotein